MADVLAIELLRKDHEEALRLAADLEAAATLTERDRARTELCETLEHHMRLEEEVLDPALAAHAALRSILEQLADGHQRLRSAVAKLCRAPLRGPNFDHLARRVSEAIRGHFVEEEDLFREAAALPELLLAGLAVELTAGHQREHGAYGV